MLFAVALVLSSVTGHKALQVVVSRPSIVGLDVEHNLKKMVDYLRSREYSDEDILQYLKTSL